MVFPEPSQPEVVPSYQIKFAIDEHLIGFHCFLSARLSALLTNNLKNMVVNIHFQGTKVMITVRT